MLIPTSAQSSRPGRIAVLAVTGAAVLSIAACTSSNRSEPTSTKPAASTPVSTDDAPPPASGEEQVSGMIASVAGVAVQVTQKDDSNATVDLTPKTEIVEITPAALTDVTMGSCVAVQPTDTEAPPGQPVTAASVRLSPAVDGKCPQAPAPAAASVTPPPPGAPGLPKPMPVRGAVASVAENAIGIATIDVAGHRAQTTVRVDDKTEYTKQAEATEDAIKQGICLTARGAKDTADTLQATTITLRQAVADECPA